jgi:hypothetical protein
MQRVPNKRREVQSWDFLHIAAHVMLGMREDMQKPPISEREGVSDDDLFVVELNQFLMWYFPTTVARKQQPNLAPVDDRLLNLIIPFI